MKIDFKAKITDMEGKPLKVVTGELDERRLPVEKELTLSDVAINALLGVYRDDDQSSAEKLLRFNLATKIQQHPDGDFTLEETVKLKQLIDKAHPQPIIYGRALEIIQAAA